MPDPYTWFIERWFQAQLRKIDESLAIVDRLLASEGPPRVGRPRDDIEPAAFIRKVLVQIRVYEKSHGPIRQEELAAAMNMSRSTLKAKLQTCEVRWHALLTLARHGH